MLIECDTCQVRGLGCGECVVAELLGAPELEEGERRALAALTDAGLIRPDRILPLETSVTGRTERAS